MAHIEKLTLSGSRSTPFVDFDPDGHRLRLRGQSYPENAFAFYEPLLKWLDRYLAGLDASASVVAELRFPYINTTSTKCVLTLLEKLDEAYRGGADITVEWHADENDESEMECAEEFREDLGLPFRIVPAAD